MRKGLLLLIILSISVLMIFCNGGTDSQDSDSNVASNSDAMNATLIQPTVKLNERTTKELPLQLWEWDGTIKRYTVATAQVSGSGTAKKMHCVIQGEGTPISVGDEIEEIEEAVCTHVMLDNNGFKKYAVGLKKIKIKSTGAIGWTWASAIQKVD
ncbi:MAG: hypothetical protein FI687_00670 [SAR202 cluster bacterium]|nr:hypothetical protein [SAR202 cluster bacterium]